jgi:phage terminase small subunit
MALTQAQENFAMAYVETGNASEAYRRAYPKSLNWKPESVNVEGCKSLANPKIAQRVAELQQVSAKRNMVTVDSLIAELEEARQIALAAETPQTSAAVGATMGKAKLCGLDKQVVELQGSIAVSSVTRRII